MTTAVEILLGRRKKFLFRDNFEGIAVAPWWTVTDTTPELVTNGNFETLGANPPIFLGYVDTAGDGSIAASATAHGGTKSAQLTTGATANTKTSITLTGLLPARQYTVSFYAQAETDPNAENARYGVYDVTNSANIVAPTEMEVDYAAWREVSTTITTPAGCTSIRVDLWCPTAGTSVLYDDLSVKPVAAISVSGGNIVFAGGKATPGWGDPRLVTVQSFARQAGLTLTAEINPTANNVHNPIVGFYNTSTPTSDANGGIRLMNTGILACQVTAGAISLPVAYTGGVSIVLYVVEKNPGYILYASTNGGVTKDAIWENSTDSAGPLYTFISNFAGAFTSAGVDVKLAAVKPPVINTTPAAPTLTLGAEEASGTLTVGNWYSITATQANYFYTGSAIGDTFRATAATVLDANNKVKNIPFSTTGSLVYLGDSGAHNGIYDAAPTASAVTQDGIVIHANSTTAPTYCLYAYVDRINAKAYLVKIDNGTTTQLVGAAVAYGAAKRLRIVSNGSSHALYYGTAGSEAIVGTVQTLDVSSNYGTNVFGMSTLATDSVGLCVVNV